ncbi:MAG TPA: hypothetical protein DIT13_12270 [Verrucomicrobiales bacterium]|nr:hypothetical protein [Verrucomicrobiales bacterium]
MVDCWRWALRHHGASAQATSAHRVHDLGGDGRHGDHEIIEAVELSLIRATSEALSFLGRLGSKGMAAGCPFDFEEFPA